MEFSRLSLNKLILRRKPQLDVKLGQFKKGGQGIHATDKEGNTMLHLAVLENRFDQLEHLIAYGHSLQLTNKWGMTPVDLAHFLGRKIFLPFLIPSRKRESIPIYRNSDNKIHCIPLIEFEEKIGISYIDHLEFEHPDYLRWSVAKCSKQLKKQNTRKMNKWTLALHEKSILTPKYNHIYIRYIDSTIGYGVFAKNDLPALTYVGEYTGIITRRHPRKTRFNDYVFGYMVGPKNTPFIIDAKRKGNFTRFINHSDCPNMNSRWVIVRGVTRIIVFTNEFIPSGEQLTYDYGKYYWRSRAAPSLI